MKSLESAVWLYELPQFPVVFLFQQGVIEPLSSVGDCVRNVCETIGAVEGFDENGGWSKIFIPFIQ